MLLLVTFVKFMAKEIANKITKYMTKHI